MGYTLQDDDIRILQLLQHDAKLTTKEMADKLGKTITPVYERIRRLEAEGFIKSYVAILDKTKVDRGLTAITHLQLKEHALDMLQAFQQECTKFPEVLECFQVAGEFDFIIKVVVRDMNDYSDFMRNKLATLPNIRTVQSFFVLVEGKSATAIPLRLTGKKK